MEVDFYRIANIITMVVIVYIWAYTRGRDGK